jgi:hypothetical protein
MCSDRNAAPADVPPIVTPAAFMSRSFFATGVPPSVVESRSWLPPVKNTPVARSSTASSSASSHCLRLSNGSTHTLETRRLRNSSS